MKRYLLLGYPRSGISWLRYICRNLYGLEEIGSHWEDDNPFVWNYDPSTPFIKRHWLDDRKYIEDSNIDLILIVRNYKECIVKHNKDKVANGMNIDDIFDRSLSTGYDNTIPSYIHPLYIYDIWPDNKRKHLVYYEDLMSTEEETIEKLAYFLQDAKGLANIFYDFIKNLEYHKRYSITLYENPDNKSETKGEELIYHSKTLTDKQKIEWDKKIRTLYPTIYHRYLHRYKD